MGQSVPGWPPSQAEALAPAELGHPSTQQHFETSPPPQSLPPARCQTLGATSIHRTLSVPLNISHPNCPPGTLLSSYFDTPFPAPPSMAQLKFHSVSPNPAWLSQETNPSSTV